MMIAINVPRGMLDMTKKNLIELGATSDEADTIIEDILLEGAINRLHDLRCDTNGLARRSIKEVKGES